MNYKRLKTRICTALLFLCTLLSLSAPALAAPDPYWAMQAAYDAALASGDDEAMCAAAEDIIAYYDHFSDEIACYRVITPLLRAVAVYESTCRYDDALRLYQTYKRCYQALDRLTDKDCTEALRYADAFLAQYTRTTPTVYAHAYEPADTPYYGAKNEPAAGTVLGMCGDYDESRSGGYLLYVQFENEQVSTFSYLLPQTEHDYMLEVAWNLSNADSNIEMLAAIANGEKDAYLKENLAYLDTIPHANILLRFGAEVNVWDINTTYAENGRLAEFKKTYIAAFRHIHDMAEQYAPRAAMVYSPNDISNMYVTHTDFYPGDDYVDWVGCSAYQNMSSLTSGEYGNMNDAYYKIGVYANQLTKIEELVNAYGDRKPIMISECGFCYASTQSQQTVAHAKEKLEYFYSYVNMLFPAVKAIFYFNTNYGANSYRLFGDGANAEVAAVYTRTTRANRVMADTVNGISSGYSRLSTLDELHPGDLTLSLYAAYPGNPAKTVTYTLDGKQIQKTDTLPYTATISAALLTQGRHTLSVKTVVGKTAGKQTVYNESFVLYVSQNGNIRTCKPDMTDVAADHWAYPYISYCMAEGFFDGLAQTRFKPTDTVNRGMFAALLGRAAGVNPADYGSSGFSDVKSNAYYAPFVTWAKEAGVTSGTSETEFSPAMILTREQICAMLVRYCDNAGIALPAAENRTPFVDTSDIADYFRDAVSRAHSAGIINGKDGNRFDPKANLTRQEIAVILKNFHERFIVNG